MSFRVPQTWMQTSQVAELAAALVAVRAANPDSELTLVLSHDYVCKAMTKKLVKWERKGWVGVHHGNILKCLAAELKARKASTTFVVAPQGSTAQTMCREATRTAKTATSGNRFRAVTLDIPAGTALVGIPLQGNRQKTFYRGIREVKTQKLKDRPSTINKLAIVKECIAILQGRIVTDEDIWCSLRNKDFQP
ncbi:hypothetical protein GGX14DRAFT_407293 [Mycena pura]|uniref:RNase H type-1 domain-containing protein n=1 Tax=Mycena pura TaxID=153505 RepID=A0AAD6XXC3_9AGAR|nr:hypothetical protein GGX14DRAFT_407293 [Mycena pura]